MKRTGEFYQGDRFFQDKPLLGGAERARFKLSGNLKRLGRGGGSLPQTHDANIDLTKLPDDVRAQVLEKMGTVIHSDGQTGNMRVYEVKGKDGKVRKIIDF